uniref:Uncharacterized protein n=1 Tax=Arundo donax TaxID=35708 RepID=A0A0A9BNS8_ARUDO
MRDGVRTELVVLFPLPFLRPFLV